MLPRLCGGARSGPFSATGSYAPAGTHSMCKSRNVAALTEELSCTHTQDANGGEDGEMLTATFFGYLGGVKTHASRCGDLFALKNRATGWTCDIF